MPALSAWISVQHELTDCIMFLRQASRLGKPNPFRGARYLRHLRLNAEHEAALASEGLRAEYWPKVRIVENNHAE